MTSHRHGPSALRWRAAWREAAIEYAIRDMLVDRFTPAEIAPALGVEISAVLSIAAAARNSRLTQ